MGVDHGPVMVRHRFAKDPAFARKDLGVCGPRGLDDPCRPLDVAEEEAEAGRASRSRTQFTSRWCERRRSRPARSREAIAATARTASHGAGASHLVCDRSPRLAIVGGIVERAGLLPPNGGRKARSHGEVEGRLEQVEPTKRGVRVGVLEHVERLGGGDDQLERVGDLVGHDDCERVVRPETRGGRRRFRSSSDVRALGGKEECGWQTRRGSLARVGRGTQPRSRAQPEQSGMPES